MPLTTALIVTGIVAAFTLFGIVLAWGDHQTRNLKRVDETKSEPAEDIKKAA